MSNLTRGLKSGLCQYMRRHGQLHQKADLRCDTQAAPLALRPRKDFSLKMNLLSCRQEQPCNPHRPIMKTFQKSLCLYCNAKEFLRRLQNCWISSPLTQNTPGFCFLQSPLWDTGVFGLWISSRTWILHHAFSRS